MTLDEIHSEWSVDSEIPIDDLASSSSLVPKLHSKWLRYLSDERILLKALEHKLKGLKFEKREWLISGDTRESREKGWVLPSKGSPLRSELSIYIEGDSEVRDLEARVSLQSEKVSVLESILNSINWRHNSIRNALDDLKFKQGL